MPVAERGGREFGCFITAREELGAFAQGFGPLLAHRRLHTPAAAKGPRAAQHRGAVARSNLALHHRGDAGWRPRAANGSRWWGLAPGRRAAYAAVYMEGVFRPGMHPRCTGIQGWRPGIPWRASSAWKLPKASWYSGQGAGVMVHGGVPMGLTGTGTGVRRHSCSFSRTPRSRGRCSRPIGPPKVCAGPSH